MERNVIIANNGMSLCGTLVSPPSGNASAIILMLHGSGPLDRNQNMQGQALDIFNTLADKLAVAGFASLRYDKRGCGESEGNYYAAGHADHVSDALAWVNAVIGGQFGAFGSIYLLGHSLGTLIAAQVAQQKTAIDGLIQICPFIDKLEITLRRQAATMETELQNTRGPMRFLVTLSELLFGSPIRQQEKLIYRLKTSAADSFRAGLQKIEAKSLRELLEIDPVEIYQGLQIPVFLFGAEKDVPCIPQDCERIAELLGANATVHIEPELTHILRKDSRLPSFLAYRDQLKQPIDPIVSKLVINWLEQQTAGQSKSRQSF